MNKTREHSYFSKDDEKITEYRVKDYGICKTVQVFIRYKNLYGKTYRFGYGFSDERILKKAVAKAYSRARNSLHFVK